MIARWFENEWRSYYGPDGEGDAERDVLGCADGRTLPVGIVALCDGVLCGVAALKAESISCRPDRAPWAAAGFVLPSFRRRGIGSKLLAGIEQLACEFRYESIYCATDSAISLLEPTRGAS